MNCVKIDFQIKKRYLFILIFQVFYNLLFSQTRIDSLQANLEKASGSQRIEILNELAESYLTESPQQALEYGIQALKLSREIDFLEGEAQALKTIGAGNYYLSNLTVVF